MAHSKLTKLYSFLFLFTIAFASMANGQETGKQSGQHMLWKIKADGQLQGYMIGSVHVMKPRIYPLDDVYRKAFQNSDIVVFEVNFDSLITKMLPLVQKLAMYPPDKSIRDALSKKHMNFCKTRSIIWPCRLRDSAVLSRGI